VLLDALIYRTAQPELTSSHAKGNKDEGHGMATMELVVCIMVMRNFSRSAYIA